MRLESRYLKFSIRGLLLLTLVAAIFVVFYLLPPKTLQDVKHVHIIEASGEDTFRFRFEPTVTRRSTDQVLNLLPVGGRLWFFDLNKTISDPGLYTTLRRTSDEQWWAHCGNHGFFSDWFPITKEEASEYFWACHDDNLVGLDDWWYTNMKFSVGSKEPPDRINRDPNYSFAVYLRELIEREGGQ